MKISIERFIKKRDNSEFKNPENLKRLVKIANSNKSDHDIWIKYGSKNMIQMLDDFNKSDQFSQQQDCNIGFWDFYEDEKAILHEVKSNVLYWLLADPNINEDDANEVKWLRKEIKTLKYYLRKWESKIK